MENSHYIGKIIVIGKGSGDVYEKADVSISKGNILLLFWKTIGGFSKVGNCFYTNSLFVVHPLNDRTVKLVVTMKDKNEMSEKEICDNFITPAIESRGWNLHSQIHREVTFTKGQILVRGSKYTRGECKRADYLLYHKPNLPIAIVEAKDYNHSVGAGMQQSLVYGTMLDIPFVYSSNGHAFLEHDFTKTFRAQVTQGSSTPQGR